MATDKNGRKLPPGIRLKPSGKYEVRVTRNSETFYSYAENLTEAKKEKNRIEFALNSGNFITKQKIKLDSWFETWIETYKIGKVKAGTVKTYQDVYNMAIKEYLGNKLIADIRGTDIQKLFNNLLNSGASLSTTQVVSAILSGCLGRAEKDGLIARNPVRLAELPRQTKKNAHIALTREQQKIFMEYAKTSYLYHFFMLMLLTGTRKGELQGLKYSDIDRKKKVIHVRRTLKYVNGGYVEDDPKTIASKRDIPLTAAMLGHIEAQRNYWGTKVVKMDCYLFTTEEGKPLSTQRIQGEINRTIEQIRAAGHDFPRITSHVFRHTFATRAIESGMQPQVLKTILGHSSLAMTMDLYSHVLPDVKAEEMQKISGAFF